MGVTMVGEAQRVGRVVRQSRFGFWAIAAVYTTLQAFMTVPSPLYGLYAERDHLSPLMITLVYAAYAIGVSMSLIFAGHLSDTLGRRPLLLAALGLNAVSAVIFVKWSSLPGLFAARVVCGVAVGVTASTATAFLKELFLAHWPVDQLRRVQLVSTGAALGGLGIGGLIAGAIAEAAGHPLIVPYAVMLVAFAVGAVAVILTPETRPRPPALPPYRPQRLAVPCGSHDRFVAALTGVAAQFAVFGLFVGLAGTFLAVTLHRNSPALAGAVLFTVFAAGVACAAATMSTTAARMTGLASTFMLIGLALLVLSAWLPRPSLTAFLFSGAFIGAGGAALFQCSLGVVIGISSPERSAETLASFFLAGYLGLSVPVIGIGVALQHMSMRAALLAFAVVIGAGVLAAAPRLRMTASPDAERA